VTCADLARPPRLHPCRSCSPPVFRRQQIQGESLLCSENGKRVGRPCFPVARDLVDSVAADGAPVQMFQDFQLLVEVQFAVEQKHQVVEAAVDHVPSLSRRSMGDFRLNPGAGNSAPLVRSHAYATSLRPRDPSIKTLDAVCTTMAMGAHVLVPIGTASGKGEEKGAAVFRALGGGDKKMARGAKLGADAAGSCRSVDSRASLTSRARPGAAYSFTQESVGHTDAHIGSSWTPLHSVHFSGAM
jgi:hypothetical protein